MTLPDLPPLTGSPILDPWRIRHRLELAGELTVVPVGRGPVVTRSEQLLWGLLEHEPPGWEREYPTGLFRLDFYCSAGRLAVEVDGGSHYGRKAGERDALRDDWHRARGITTKRFSAGEVERDPRWVLDEIRQLVATDSTAQADAVDVETVPGMPPMGSDESIPAQAQQMAAQLPLAAAPNAREAGLQAVERALAEACRTVLPEHRSVLRQFVQLFEPQRDATVVQTVGSKGQDCVVRAVDRG